MTNREKPPAILITLLHEVRQLRAQVDRLAPRNRPVENPADDPAEALRMQCEARGDHRFDRRLCEGSRCGGDSRAIALRDEESAPRMPDANPAQKAAGPHRILAR